MTSGTNGRFGHRIKTNKALLRPDRKEERKLHRSVKEWDQQEESERIIRRPRDFVSEWVGVRLHYREYTDPLWRDTADQDPEIVSRYYPHEKLIVDFPEAMEDVQRRVILFERLGIKYMFVGEEDGEFGERQFKQRLKTVREDHEKTNRRTAGAGAGF